MVCPVPSLAHLGRPSRPLSPLSPPSAHRASLPPTRGHARARPSSACRSPARPPAPRPSAPAAAPPAQSRPLVPGGQRARPARPRVERQRRSAHRAQPPCRAHASARGAPPHRPAPRPRPRVSRVGGSAPAAAWSASPTRREHGFFPNQTAYFLSPVTQCFRPNTQFFSPTTSLSALPSPPSVCCAASRPESPRRRGELAPSSLSFPILFLPPYAFAASRQSLVAPFFFPSETSPCRCPASRPAGPTVTP
jgi:hypothetical protein